MGYAEKIKLLAAKAHENDLASGEPGDFELNFVSRALDTISDYHDFVVRLEKNIQTQRFRLEGPAFADWQEAQDSLRISKHKCMIDGVAQLNRYSKANGLNPFYEGPFDDEQRYNDPDTRFGIAEMSEEYCSEVFLSGQNDIVNQKHIDYTKQRLAELDNKSASKSLPTRNKDEISRGGEFDFAENEMSTPEASL